MTKQIAFTKPVNLIEYSQKRWRLLQAYLLRKKKSFKHVSVAKFLNWATKFNPSQWCYFIAITYLLFNAIFYEVSESNVLMAGAISFFGLFREMWNMFQRIWEHNIGKALVLVVYAGTTNFALAFAAIKINEITGIEPTPFIFTLGFTTLLMLPFWIIMSNIVFLLIGLILANLLLFISIPFKLIGIRLPVHWEDKHRAGTTMLLRIILIPIVIFSLFTFISPYFAQLDIGTSSGPLKISVVEDEQNTDSPTNETEAQVGQESEAALETPQEPEEVSVDEAINRVMQAFIGEQNISEETTPDETSPPKASVIYRLIAKFIFTFESYQYSACQKSPEQHSVVIDEDTVLLIRPDESAAYGYQYQVAACVPVYEPTQG